MQKNTPTWRLFFSLFVLFCTLAGIPKSHAIPSVITPMAFVGTGPYHTGDGIVVKVTFNQGMDIYSGCDLRLNVSGALRLARITELFSFIYHKPRDPANRAVTGCDTPNNYEPPFNSPRSENAACRYTRMMSKTGDNYGRF